MNAKDPFAITFGHGGARPGAGRPKGYSPVVAARLAAGKTQASSEGSAPGDSEASQHRVDFARSRAMVEEVKAKHAELDYRSKLGDYVSREAVRTACAMTIAAFDQAFRNLPADMERTLALPPEITACLAAHINEAMKQLRRGFEPYVGAVE